MRSSAKQEELVKAFKALLKEEKFSSQAENAHVAGHFDKVHPAEYLTSLPG